MEWDGVEDVEIDEITNDDDDTSNRELRIVCEVTAHGSTRNELAKCVDPARISGHSLLPCLRLIHSLLTHSLLTQSFVAFLPSLLLSHSLLSLLLPVSHVISLLLVISISGGIEYVPFSTIPVAEDSSFHTILAQLEDNEDVQQVYHNVEC